MEEFLVEELFKAIKGNPDLKVTIVLDQARGIFAFLNDQILISI